MANSMEAITAVQNQANIHCKHNGCGPLLVVVCV